MCVVGLVIFMYSILLCISFVLHVKKKKKKNKSLGGLSTPGGCLHVARVVSTYA